MTVVTAGGDCRWIKMKRENDSGDLSVTLKGETMIAATAG